MDMEGNVDKDCRLSVSTLVSNEYIPLALYCEQELEVIGPGGTGL